jgi:hypothetical protein
MKKLGFKSNVYEINSLNIDQFDFLENKRKLRENKVTKIKNVIVSGNHFDAPIVVNKNGKMRVIDGQHRICAIKKAIEENNEFKIEILLVSYDRLDTKTEREIFNRWNIGTKQTSDDFVQMHEDDITILAEMKKNFPVEISIYKESGKAHFKLLSGSYIAAKANKRGGYTSSNQTFVDQAIILDKIDYMNIKKFVKDFFINVGPFDKSNMYANTTPFNALMYIYFHNVLNNKVSQSDFWDRFSKKVRAEQYITSMSQAGGVQPTKIVTNLMMGAMNNVPSTRPQLILPYSADNKEAEEELEG